jgi:hypothetical protein
MAISYIRKDNNAKVRVEHSTTRAAYKFVLKVTNVCSTRHFV